VVNLGPAIGWVAFGVVHSTLASLGGTAFLQRRFGVHHRLVYSGVAISTLAPLLVYSTSVRGEPFLRWRGTLVFVPYALLAGAIALFLAGGRHYSLSRLLGFAQLRQGAAVGLAAQGRLDSTGILGVIRHPWYTACLLLPWARDLDASAFVAGVAYTLYVFVGTWLEERKLVVEFGDEYREYQRRVSMFVPLKWAAARLRGVSRLP
jgi:protein-S-isoprenylcysteine O-methyltransferase Ste14